MTSDDVARRRQVINLHYVPVPFQAIVVSVVNVGWKTTLSLLNHYHAYGSPQKRSKEQQLASEEIATLRRAVRRLEAELEATRHQSLWCAWLCPPCSRHAAQGLSSESAPSEPPR